MQLAQNTLLAPPKRPPPLWYVSNGELTVGPVRSNLLVRGVWHERIPDDCWIREARWADWRPLSEVREVSAVRRAKRAGFDAPRLVRPALTPDRFHTKFRHAQDASEVLLLLLAESMERTHATFGMIHRCREAYGTPVISYARGPGMCELLGQAIPDGDPSLAVARTGNLVHGPPQHGFVERSIALRIGVPRLLAGVAMVPIATERHLLAVMELGRRDHTFRDQDARMLAFLAGAAVRRLRRAC
ncbi:MAG: GAF domain-containing protein [Polyangiaceae bacterium]